MAEIYRRGNGWELILDYEDAMVFQDKDGDWGDRESFVEMLWALSEHYGMRGGRYDEKRVKVELEPGDKP